VSLVHAVEVPRRPLSLLEPVIGGPRYLRLRAAEVGRDAAADYLSSSGAATVRMPSAEEPGRRVRPSGHCAGGVPHAGGTAPAPIATPAMSGPAPSREAWPEATFPAPWAAGVDEDSEIAGFLRDLVGGEEITSTRRSSGCWSE
jgi:hypothetical protein